MTGTPPLLDGCEDRAQTGWCESCRTGPSRDCGYGHRTSKNDRAAGCQDTELVVPVAPLDRPRMLGAIASYRASGFTPIGLSLQQAAADLPPEGPRTIVLVTDGEDTCGPPDPCQVARDLSASGVAVRIETVGFYLKDNRLAEQQLQCIASATAADNAGPTAPTRWTRSCPRSPPARS